MRNCEVHLQFFCLVSACLHVVHCLFSRISWQKQTPYLSLADLISLPAPIKFQTSISVSVSALQAGLWMQRKSHPDMELLL